MLNRPLARGNLLRSDGERTADLVQKRLSPTGLRVGIRVRKGMETVVSVARWLSAKYTLTGKHKHEIFGFCRQRRY